MVTMEISIHGHHLPGRHFCRADGSPLDDVHVGVQERAEPTGLVAGDAESATWHVHVRVIAGDGGQLDFRGPAVQGKPGERFVYLTWGNVGPDGEFEMFRRAKLMLNRIDPDLVRSAEAAGRPLRATVDLTDARGGPRCARVDPPALIWSLP